MLRIKSTTFLWELGHLPFTLLCFGLAILVISNFLLTNDNQHFIWLAGSFIDGKLYLPPELNGWGDTVSYLGKTYWPLGPLPAFILTPFVYLFGSSMRQDYLSFFLNILNLILLYRIGYKITKSSETAVWISIAYVFASPYLALASQPGSWYFAQVVTTTAILLSLHEFFYRRRWFLIGTFLAMAILTRVNTLSTLFFFTFFILFLQQKETAYRSLRILYLPIFLCLIILFSYNYFRFDHLLEQGYKYQLISGELLANRNYGLWSFIHFPANLYFLFLKGPEGVFIPGTKVMTFPFLLPNKWGMSIFLTTPFFIWIYKTPWKDSIVKLSLATAILGLFTVLGYYGIGFVSYGYRYALDFYPFIFIMLAYALKGGVTKTLKTVIIISFLFTYYFVLFQSNFLGG